jgi:MoaA/NifB/PqqE/SkfB family radical SAM enzyme
MCTYCYASLAERRVKSARTLSAKAIAEHFDRTNRAWNVHMTGGEPFLFPDFVGVCKGISSNHYLSINTNLSTDNVGEFAVTIDPARIIVIRASLHIAERERLKLYERFIAGAICLQRRGFNVQVDYVLHPPLWSRVRNDISDLEKQGVRTINVVSFKGNYRGRQYPGAYDAREKEYIAERSVDARQRTIAHEGVFQRFGHTCKSGARFFVMDPNGDVRRCTTSKRRLGNLFMDTLPLDEPARPCPFLKCDCYYQAIDWCADDKAHVLSIGREVLRELPAYYIAKLRYYKAVRFLEKRYPAAAFKVRAIRRGWSGRM